MEDEEKKEEKEGSEGNKFKSSDDGTKRLRWIAGHEEG